MKAYLNKQPIFRKIFQALLISFLLSVIICGLHTIIRNQYDIREFESLLCGKIYHVKNITPVNYKVDGDHYTSVNEDAILLFPDMDKRVVNVVVNFKKPLEKVMQIELYYDLDGSGFCEEQKSIIQLPAGKKNVEFILRQEVHTIRLDIGNQSGENFWLKNIEVNRINWYETDLVLYFGLLFLISLCLQFRNSTVVRKLYQHRYLIGLVGLVICMVLGLHGSSINAWGYLTGYQYYDHYPSEIFGTWRIVRGDEYGILTPMAFAQAQNDYGYFSDLFGSYGMDMFMVYGQAVKDIAVIFRPFYLGYLLFGLRMGLSFFWCGRFILLFLVSWD